MRRASRGAPVGRRADRDQRADAGGSRGPEAPERSGSGRRPGRRVAQRLVSAPFAPEALGFGTYARAFCNARGRALFCANAPGMRRALKLAMRLPKRQGRRALRRLQRPRGLIQPASDWFGVGVRIGVMTKTTKIDDRIAKLEDRLKQLKVRQQRVDARRRTLSTRQARRDDTRRKILVGAVVLARVERGEWDEATLRSWLDGALVRLEDRGLFGL